MDILIPKALSFDVIIKPTNNDTTRTNMASVDPTVNALFISYGTVHATWLYVCNIN